MEAPSSWGALELTIADAMKEAEQARVDKIIGLSTVRRIADRLRGGGFVCDDANHHEREQPEPPFDENHHRYHTPRGPNPECANCRYVNFSQPDPPSLPCNCAGPGKGCLRGQTEEECECLAGNCTC